MVDILVLEFTREVDGWELSMKLWLILWAYFRRLLGLNNPNHLRKIISGRSDLFIPGVFLFSLFKDGYRKTGESNKFNSRDINWDMGYHVFPGREGVCVTSVILQAFRG